MQRDLVVVAECLEPWRAAIMANRLRSEGISAFVLDAEMSSLFWHYQNAIGGAKVGVPRGEQAWAEQRIRELTSHHDDADAISADAAWAEADEEDTPTAWADEPPSERVEPDAEVPASDHQPCDDSDRDDARGDDGPPPTPGEQLAERAWRSALAGLAFPPIWAWGLWLLLKLFVLNPPLRPRYRRSYRRAAAVILPCLTIVLLALRAIVFD